MMYTRLIYCLLLAISFSSVQAQTNPFPVDPYTNKITFRKVVTFDSSKSAYLYKKAIDFAKLDQDKFFISNGDHAESLLAQPNTRKYGINNHLKENVGFISSDKEDYSINIAMTVQYNGGFGSCISTMVVDCDVIIMFKEGRSKIDITNFRYTNFDHIMQQLPIAGMKDKQPCKAADDLEQLVQCDRCAPTLQKVFDFIGNSCDDMLAKYATYIQQQSHINQENW